MIKRRGGGRGGEGSLFCAWKLQILLVEKGEGGGGVCVGGASGRIYAGVFLRVLLGLGNCAGGGGGGGVGGGGGGGCLSAAAWMAFRRE